MVFEFYSTAMPAHCTALPGCISILAVSNVKLAN